MFYEFTIDIIINLYSSYNVFIITSLLTGRKRVLLEQPVVIKLIKTIPVHTYKVVQI